MAQYVTASNLLCSVYCKHWKRCVAFAGRFSFYASGHSSHKKNKICFQAINSPSKTFQKRKTRFHDFHANAQPARLPAAANTSYSCWWCHSASSPAPMLRYVRLSRSSVGDTLLARENSWNCSSRLTLQGPWKLEEAELLLHLLGVNIFAWFNDLYAIVLADACQPCWEVQGEITKRFQFCQHAWISTVSLLAILVLKHFKE